VVAVIVALGFYPRPILDAITPAVNATLQQTGNTDPVPAVPLAAPVAAPAAASATAIPGGSS
jgi:NADH-quinone oxidoreductase subunit M